MGRPCCKPKPCCGGENEPLQADECMCGCFCLNGSCQVSTALALTFIGYIFSLASLGDCAFVHVADGIPLPERFDNDDFPPPRRLGYITFERLDGTCYWYNDGILYPEEQIQAYFRLLGSDWQVGRIFLAAVCSVSWFGFMYTFSLCCSSQVKGVRYFFAFVHSIGLTLFQSLSFLVFGSPFCTEHDCTMDRSAEFSIAAACCYFVAGICFIIMGDYPGKNGVGKSPKGYNEGVAASGSDEAVTASRDEQVEIDVEAPQEERQAAAAATAPTEPVEAEARVISENRSFQSETSMTSSKRDPPDYDLEEDDGKLPATENDEQEATKNNENAEPVQEEAEIVDEEVIDEDETNLEDEKVKAQETTGEDDQAGGKVNDDKIEEKSLDKTPSPEEKKDEGPDIEPVFTVEDEA